MFCTLNTVGRGYDVRESLRDLLQGQRVGKGQRQDSNSVSVFCVLFPQLNKQVPLL